MATAQPRFVIVGAGAIGGVLAAELHLAGFEVEVVARGAHLDAIRDRGLTRIAPDGRVTVRLPAHRHVGDADLDDGTVVVVATKVHQAEPVLDQLLATAGPDVPVATVQNGVEGERLALRRFRDVYAVLVNTPGVHLTPGEVEVYATPPRGVLDVGRYPSGVDDRAASIAAAWTDAGFLSEACHDIMSRKWAKLLGNTGNALQVLFGPEPGAHDRVQPLLRAEAEAVARAMGIVPDVGTQQHRARLVARADLGEVARPGGSTWQSAVRATGDVETVMLNGEIVLQGRLVGVPTPANELVMAETLALIAAGDEVGSRDQAAFLARLPDPEGSEPPTL